MDPLTKTRAHQKLSSIKEYIGYPDEILNSTKLNALYDGLHIDESEFFENGHAVNMWSVNYHTGRLREKVCKED